MDDELGLLLREGLSDACEIRQVKFMAHQAADIPIWRMNRCQTDEIAPNQTIRASYPSCVASHSWLVEKA